MSRATDLLKQCIDGKWALLVKEPLADEPDCVLCAEYDSFCSECPVLKETGERTCDGTPYWDWREARGSSPRAARVDEIRAAAQAEQDWLRALHEKLMKEEAA